MNIDINRYVGFYALFCGIFYFYFFNVFLFFLLWIAELMFGANIELT